MGAHKNLEKSGAMILYASAHFPPEPVTAATLCHDLAMAMSEERKGYHHNAQAFPPLRFLL